VFLRVSNKRCPFCGGSHLRRSHSYVRSFWRWFMDVQTVYCPDCHSKWGMRDHTAVFYRKLFARGLMPFILLLGFSLLGPESNPAYWLKQKVVQAYNSHYGEESTIMKVQYHYGDVLNEDVIKQEFEEYKREYEEYKADYNARVKTSSLSIDTPTS